MKTPFTCRKGYIKIPLQDLLSKAIFNYIKSTYFVNRPFEGSMTETTSCLFNIMMGGMGMPSCSVRQKISLN